MRTEPDASSADSQQLLNECFIALANQSGFVSLDAFFTFLSTSRADEHVSEQQISAVMHDAGITRPSEVGAGTGPGLSLAAFRAVMTRLAHLRFHAPSSESTASNSAFALPECPVAGKGGNDNAATSGGTRSGWMSWGDEQDVGAAGQRPEAVQARLVRDLLSGGTFGKRQPCEKPQQDTEEEEAESENGVVQQEIELYKWVQHELKPGIMSSGLLTSLGTRAGATLPSGSRFASNPLSVTPALSVRTDSPVPAFQGPSIPCRPPDSGTEGAGRKGSGKTGDGAGSQTAALEAAEPSESELAKVLLTFLPKREPLMRVLDHYRNLHAKEQAERKGAAGGEKQKGSGCLPLHLWKRFLSDFDVMPTLLGRRCAEMLYQRSFIKPEMSKHPLYSKFALALAHTSLFVFNNRAKTVEQGAQDLLAHLHASNGVDVVRAGSSASSKALLLVTPNELSAASAVRPASSDGQGDAQGKAPVWDRADEFKKNGLKKAAATKAQLVLAEEAEAQMRPTLTDAARHKVRSHKDLTKWAQDRDKRIAAQKLRWEKKEKALNRAPILCPRSMVLCAKTAGNREADVVERLLGYGEEYKALKEQRRMEISLEREHCAATARRNVNTLSHQLVMAREMEEEVDSIERPLSAADRLYRHHFERQELLEQKKSQLLEQEQIDPETGRHLFNPQINARSARLRENLNRPADLVQALWEWDEQRILKKQHVQELQHQRESQQAQSTFINPKSRKLSAKRGKGKAQQSSAGSPTRDVAVNVEKEEAASASASPPALHGQKSGGPADLQGYKEGEIGQLTFHPDINPKSRMLDAQTVRGEGRQPRYQELYEMTAVYQQRRANLKQHYDQQQAKVCTFQPSRAGSTKLAPERPQSAPPAHIQDENHGFDSYAERDPRELEDAASLFHGLSEGGWLHGDVNTEDALETLHASMLRQEAAERSAHAAAAAHARMSKCYGAADVGGEREAADLSGITSTVASSALQLSADFAALMTRQTKAADESFSPNVSLPYYDDPFGTRGLAGGGSAASAMRRSFGGTSASAASHATHVSFSDLPRRADNPELAFLPSIRGPIQTDKHVHVHTRTQKTAFHESLYDKGKEAQRRKQAWADKQKQVQEAKELQACSFWPATLQNAGAAVIKKTVESKSGASMGGGKTSDASPHSQHSQVRPRSTSPRRKAPSSGQRRGAAFSRSPSRSPKRSRSPKKKSVSASVKAFKNWAEKGLDPGEGGISDSDLVWCAQSRSWKRQSQATTQLLASGERQASYSATASSSNKHVPSPKSRPLASSNLSNSSPFPASLSQSPAKYARGGGGGGGGGARAASARGSPSLGRLSAGTPTPAPATKPRPQSAARAGSVARVGGADYLSASAHQLGGHAKGEGVRKGGGETGHWLSASPQRVSPSARSPSRGGSAGSPLGPPILTRSDSIEYTGRFGRG